MTVSGEKPQVFSIGERDVELTKPTSGQQFVILQMLDLQQLDQSDASDRQVMVDSCLNFGTVLRTCFVKPEDNQFVLRGMATGKLDLEDYFSLAQEMILRFAPEQIGNRETRRALPRKAPAKKAARAGARTR